MGSPRHGQPRHGQPSVTHRGYVFADGCRKGKKPKEFDITIIGGQDTDQGLITW